MLHDRKVKHKECKRGEKRAQPETVESTEDRTRPDERPGVDKRAMLHETGNEERESKAVSSSAWKTTPNISGNATRARARDGQKEPVWRLSGRGRGRSGKKDTADLEFSFVLDTSQ